MKPTNKSGAIDATLTAAFGIDRKETIETKKCALSCANPDVNFRDELSRKEYGISGLCQTCQDSIFG